MAARCLVVKEDLVTKRQIAIGVKQQLEPPEASIRHPQAKSESIDLRVALMIVCSPRCTGCAGACASQRTPQRSCAWARSLGHQSATLQQPVMVESALDPVPNLGHVHCGLTPLPTAPSASLPGSLRSQCKTKLPPGSFRDRCFERSSGNDEA